MTNNSCLFIITPLRCLHIWPHARSSETHQSVVFMTRWWGTGASPARPQAQACAVITSRLKHSGSSPSNMKLQEGRNNLPCGSNIVCQGFILPLGLAHRKFFCHQPVPRNGGPAAERTGPEGTDPSVPGHPEHSQADWACPKAKAQGRAKGGHREHEPGSARTSARG